MPQQHLVMRPSKNYINTDQSHGNRIYVYKNEFSEVVVT